MLDNYTIERFSAQVERLNVRQEVTRDVLFNASFKMIEDTVRDSMIFILEKKLAAKETIEGTQSVSYLIDWWQHLKQRWFPSWALKTWPVLMTVKTFNTRIVKMCPHVAVPQTDSEHLQWLVKV